MIDLTKRKSLPNVINIHGRDFSIQTDFRVWIQLDILIREHLHDKASFDVSFVFKNDMPYRIDISDLFPFLYPESPLPRKIRAMDDRVISLDYKLDADLIYASFKQQYSIDLVEIEYLHYHQFLALIKASKGTMLSEVMGYRSYKKETRKNIDHYEELRDAWEIREEMSEAERKTLEEFNKQFGGDVQWQMEP